MRKGQIKFYIFLLAALVLVVFAGNLFLYGFKLSFGPIERVESESFGFYKEDGRFIYVGGAVSKSGFYFIGKYITYRERMELAGTTSFTAPPSDIDSIDQIVSFARKEVIFDFSINGKTFGSINLNSRFFTELARPFLDCDVILTIERFKTENGFFTDIGQLEALLGNELYSQVFYMIYVGESL